MRRQKSEVGDQRADDRRQRADDGGQKSEDRQQRADKIQNSKSEIGEVPSAYCSVLSMKKGGYWKVETGIGN